MQRDGQVNSVAHARVRPLCISSAEDANQMLLCEMSCLRRPGPGDPFSRSFPAHTRVHRQPAPPHSHLQPSVTDGRPPGCPPRCLRVGPLAQSCGSLCSGQADLALSRTSPPHAQTLALPVAAPASRGLSHRRQRQILLPSPSRVK